METNKNEGLYEIRIIMNFRNVAVSLETATIHSSLKTSIL